MEGVNANSQALEVTKYCCFIWDGMGIRNQTIYYIWTIVKKKKKNTLLSTKSFKCSTFRVMLMFWMFYIFAVLWVGYFQKSDAQVYCCLELLLYFYVQLISEFFFSFPKFWIFYFFSSLCSPSMLTRKLVGKWKSAEGNRPNFTGSEQRLCLRPFFQPFSPITKKSFFLFFFWVKSYSHSILFHLLGNF